MFFFSKIPLQQNPHLFRHYLRRVLDFISEIGFYNSDDSCSKESNNHIFTQTLTFSFDKNYFSLQLFDDKSEKPAAEIRGSLACQHR